MNDFDSIFIHRIGLRSSLISPNYDIWKQKRDIEDEESDLISYIQQLNEEDISSYLTDEILSDARTWNDEHGCGVIQLIRYSIIDHLESKRQRGTTVFDDSRPNQWVTEDFESVRAGELCFKRRLRIYSTDIYLNESNQ